MDNEKQHPAWVTAVMAAEGRFRKQAKQHGAVTWEEESSYIRQAFQASPDLQACTPQSIQNAVEMIGAIGISISPLHKLAFIQNRNVKVSRKPDVWQAHAELNIQFTGLIKIAVDSGAASYIRADVVHENDTFVYNGPTAKPDFKVPSPFDTDGRGPVVGAFAEALGEDGITFCEILTMDDLKAIESASKATYGPWKDFPNEMRKKAAIRRLYKTLPKRSSRIIAASALSAENDGFDFSDSGTGIPTYSPDELTQFHQALKDNDAALIWHMSRRMPTSVWTDLYNSGKKGEVTKVKKLVTELNRQGLAEFQAVAVELTRMMPNDDQLGAKQILEDYSEMMETVMEQIDDPDVQAWIGEIEL